MPRRKIRLPAPEEDVIRKPPVKALIRKWKKGVHQGGIVVVFPEVPTDIPETCKIYQHIPDLGAASYHAIESMTVQATEKEARQYLVELARMGIHFEVAKRISKKMDEVRKRRFESRDFGMMLV